MLEPVLNVVMAVYGQPLMLQKQLRTLHEYEPHVRDRLRVIVVDDHGTPAVDPDWCRKFDGLDLHVYRVVDDIPWNQMGARNLGMEKAAPTWCLMIDPDMVFRESMMVKILTITAKMKRRHVIRYGLKHVSEPDREIDKTSPNTYLIHRDDFLGAGGYDESYRGHKGWSDVQMLDVLKAHYTIDHRADVFADFYSTKQISDAAVHSLNRSTAHNKKLRVRRVEQAKKAGGWVPWVQRHKSGRIQFAWSKVFPQP